MTSVVFFPWHRRVGRVREIADKLSGKSGDSATAYWRLVVQKQRKSMARIGIEGDAADEQLRALFNAVQNELRHSARDGAA
ncbi:DUF6074 family protein [Aquibium microcysteis]|uniref:DUF6074 family protein n=1 Tax=Aquibium microcysteis TaxID=675281 RepID=UPI00165CF8DA|nr:DUF6074 family protein [Aquibium microcysteis]